MSIRRLLIPFFLAAVLIPVVTAAYTLEQFAFDNPERASEFRALLGELRCVVCQNETLAGSQADVAQIMREEVYRLFQEGLGEEQVKAHLVARYTDFVLYDPPLKPSTYLLWIGPFVLIGVGAFALTRTLLRKRQSPERELSDEERQRLRTLIARAGSNADASK